MKSWSTILNILVCLAGGALIGFNAGHLNGRLNVALFVAGLGMVSTSLALLGLRGRNRHQTEQGVKNE